MSNILAHLISSPIMFPVLKILNQKQVSRNINIFLPNFHEHLSFAVKYSLTQFEHLSFVEYSLT